MSSKKKTSKSVKALSVAKSLVNTVVGAINMTDGQQLVEAETLEETIQIILQKMPQAVLIAAKAEIAREMKDDRPERKPIPEAIRNQVMERDRFRCVYCHTRNPLHIHHFVPVSKGGGNAVGNLVLLCPNCHTLVHAKNIKLKKPSSRG